MDLGGGYRDTLTSISEIVRFNWTEQVDLSDEESWCDLQLVPRKRSQSNFYSFLADESAPGAAFFDDLSYLRTVENVS